MGSGVAMNLIDLPFDDWHNRPGYDLSPLVSHHRFSVFSPTRRFRSLERYLPRDVDGRLYSELEIRGFDHEIN